MGRQQEYTEFWWGNRMGRVYVEDLSVDAKIIFKGIIKKWYGGMDWIDLAQNRDRWCAFVSAVINFQVP
jgi:hypothetical protein